MAEKFKTRGFTLIELLLVIAIIGLLASIIFAVFGTARAKADDARTIAETTQIRTDFNLNSQLPNPGTINSYFCLGKTDSQTCNFWGNTYSGTSAVANATPDLTNIPQAPVTIDGASFDTPVYKCKSITNGVCAAAIYWVQSSNTACTGGILVYQGSGGYVCASNAADSGTDNVEAVPQLFNWGLFCDSRGVCTSPVK